MANFKSIVAFGIGAILNTGASEAVSFGVNGKPLGIGGMLSAIETGVYLEVFLVH